jgi:hypothetical protein
LRILFFADQIKALTESFDSKLLRGNPYFGNFGGIFAFQGLSDVTHGYPRITDAEQASQGCPKKAAKLTQ